MPVMAPKKTVVIFLKIDRTFFEFLNLSDNRDISNFKDMLLDSMHKKLIYFRKRFHRLKNVSSQTEEIGKVRIDILKNAGKLHNRKIYNKKNHDEKKEDLQKKVVKRFDYKKQKLSDDYYYGFDKEQSDKIHSEKPIKLLTK